MYYINLGANFTLHYFSTTPLLYYLIWSKGEIDYKKTVPNDIFFVSLPNQWPFSSRDRTKVS